MKHNTLKLALLLGFAALFSGCYTQLAVTETRYRYEPRERTYSAPDDTIAGSEDENLPTGEVCRAADEPDIIIIGYRPFYSRYFWRYNPTWVYTTGWCTIWDPYYYDPFYWYDPYYAPVVYYNWYPHPYWGHYWGGYNYWGNNDIGQVRYRDKETTRIRNMGTGGRSTVTAHDLTRLNGGVSRTSLGGISRGGTTREGGGITLRNHNPGIDRRPGVDAIRPNDPGISRGAVSRGGATRNGDVSRPGRDAGTSRDAVGSSSGTRIENPGVSRSGRTDDVGRPSRDSRREQDVRRENARKQEQQRRESTRETPRQQQPEYRYERPSNERPSSERPSYDRPSRQSEPQRSAPQRSEPSRGNGGSRGSENRSSSSSGRGR